MVLYHQETFTPEEQQVLERFFTNIEGPVFALVNLPEVVKGALFARYSRSSKSIRRLFLDEFANDPESGVATLAGAMDGDDPMVDLRAAERLYDRVFSQYGDDSVAQLGGAHLACEQASNILTKVLEWGRLAAYLEQSTRYIYYDTTVDDQYRYVTPPELSGTPWEARYREHTDGMFDQYSTVVRGMAEHYRARFPRSDDDTPVVYNSTIRAKACDAARGLLPASTRSNVGIAASGQAFEMALIRMQAHPLSEVRAYGEMMLEELRKVIPSFLTRVDRPDRGVQTARHLQAVDSALVDTGRRLDAPGQLDAPPDDRAGEPWSVTLTGFDPDGERKVAASALYAVTEASDSALLAWADRLSDDEVRQVIAAMCGDRSNRRHRPGRAMESTTYRFDVVCDFGAFRDLQRHRLMRLEWQPLSTRLGFDRPDDIDEAGFGSIWEDALGRSVEITEGLRSEFGADVSQYTVPFAAHMRFVMEMNARQAFHLIELRSQPAGHVAYRRIAHEMHRLIADHAGHRAIADAMVHVDHSDVDLERLDAERRAEKRRTAGRSARSQPA